LAMLGDIGGALERAHLTNPSDIAPIPLDAELEVLIWVEELHVDTEWRHALLLTLGLNLAGHLLQANHHKLGGLERREADDDVDDPAVDIALRGCLAVALDEVGIAGCAPLERALPKQIVHECAEVQANLRPER